MYAHFVVFFAIIMCLELSSSVNPLKPRHNIHCQTLPQVVAVGGPGLPYFVELYQCQGSIEGFPPNVKKCTFNTSHDVKVELTNHKEVTLKNHTSCKPQCTHQCSSKYEERDESTCVCKCNHATPPVQCPKNYKWNGQSCNCTCEEQPSTSAKKFDKKQCKLVCRKSPDECRAGFKLNSNCRCRPFFGAVTHDNGPDDAVQGKVLAALMIGEFVLLYLIFDCILYQRNAGLMYRVLNKCRRRAKTGQPGNFADQGDTRSFLENGEATNVPLKDVKIDKNGASHIVLESK